MKLRPGSLRVSSVTLGCVITPGWILRDGPLDDVVVAVGGVTADEGGWAGDKGEGEGLHDVLAVRV